MDFDGMDFDATQAVIDDLNRQVEDLRTTIRQACRVRDSKQAMKDAEVKLAAMNPAERAALQQLLAPVGVESPAKTGGV